MSIVQIYARLIAEGRRTLDSVPANIRAEVEAAINSGGGA
ncbi:CD1375 family protein [Paenibacillus abyssi]|uniref:ASCH domain-containing protein n=1 Tax=Paenibacillus abyssi TaxID=1340531 RepID=A0A917FKT3_9BACL|nr:CD1375 family protein [Paenibacillus abyssi]GGF88581.1 hypothetical protein GCM10010916_02400 [Paenibacillus abyssi]